MWLDDFLSGRNYRVKVGTMLSGSKLATCGVPQGAVLSPVLFGIYVNEISSIHCKQGCLQKSEFQNPSEQLLNDSNTVRFAFIRDPIQRFVSLYIDKCVQTDFCFDCNKDMRCFVRNIYETLKNISNHRNEKKRKLNLLALHSAPLSWMCNFEKDLEKWDLLMIGSDFEERKSPILKLANILKRQGVNETTVEKIQKETLGGYQYTV
ncbi:Protein CBG17863 [Caenorhabditis briggsae]|uniref:Protein CBG17863 n=1 Tax=Caenorhabditis briggsae TaxID=6238 RepID=A8XRY9_CAEBR|nr:Protein CBG17863 [Caenorhabditis briggsae]CAP35408.2 Protein CBG17863 [Caenorhabditis briggsae]